MRTTITTAASTTSGRIGAVHPHPAGLCPDISGVTVSTLYRTAPNVIAHVPTDSARSAERICAGLIGAFIAAPEPGAVSGR
ncbi:hypothetical protein [Kitasatospora sp. NPDC002965]|uniref:hypothetical protein n=1 Tax=Kitasatospora sp. NPDC002965 TaxID=3154775 RepID=UPI0033A71F18